MKEREVHLLMDCFVFALYSSWIGHVALLLFFRLLFAFQAFVPNIQKIFETILKNIDIKSDTINKQSRKYSYIALPSDFLGCFEPVICHVLGQNSFRLYGPFFLIFLLSSSVFFFFAYSRHSLFYIILFSWILPDFMS